MEKTRLLGRVKLKRLEKRTPLLKKIVSAGNWHRLHPWAVREIRQFKTEKEKQEKPEPQKKSHFEGLQT